MFGPVDVHQSIPGNCAECHIVSADDSASSAWKSVEKPRNLKTFTQFDHTPHLTLPTLSDCKHCHQFDEEKPQSTLRERWQDLAADSARLGNRVSPVAYESQTCEHLLGEFQPMRRQQCTACHHPGSASDACTQCHNYHVGNAGYLWQSAQPAEAK